ncbi:hypothetical protein [Lagierella massiliensis]|uniref:hypothetical protein n=1 Tax=Lagierella massiliensis TaxID=1689303 RepID=UPI0006D7C162|nr:hypothetical protein [Lagierella massiliensis]
MEYRELDGFEEMLEDENFLMFKEKIFKTKKSKETNGNDLNPKIRNTDGGVFLCQNTQKNLK